MLTFRAILLACSTLVRSQELGGLAPYDVARDCTPEDSFVHVDFRNAELVRSNLGGQGGPCATTADCTETCSGCAGPECAAVECIGMAREIYIKKVAVNGEGIGQCPWFHVPRLHQLKLPCIYAVACTE